MSTLENDVSSLIIAMFDHARFLDETERSALATWAAKMATLIDAASPEPTIPKGFGHDLQIQRHPHHAARVWLGGYADQDNAMAGGVRPIFAEHDGPVDDPIACCVTFTAFRLVFQVFIPFNDGSLTLGPEFDKALIQLWPLTSGPIKWPPPYRFANDSLPALVQRINDGRGSVQMNVELHSSFGQRPDGTD